MARRRSSSSVLRSKGRGNVVSQRIQAERRQARKNQLPTEVRAKSTL